MIAATPANRVFLFEGAMDMRKGFEGLSAMVSDNRIRPANHTCPKAGSREPIRWNRFRALKVVHFEVVHSVPRLCLLTARR